MSYYVYIHTCPNGKRYIGTTRMTKPELRWGHNGYKYKDNNHFYRAIQKYGWDNIEHQVIEVESESEMYYLERYLIAYYQSNKNDFGYNKSLGGEKSGWKGGVTSDPGYMKQYRESHKELLRLKHKQYMKEYEETHKEEKRKYQRERYYKNKINFSYEEIN